MILSPTQKLPLQSILQRFIVQRRKRLCLEIFSEPACWSMLLFRNALIMMALTNKRQKSFWNRIFLSAHICHPSKSVIGFPIWVSGESERNERNKIGQQRLARSYLDFNLRSGTRSAPESSSFRSLYLVFFLFFLFYLKEGGAHPRPSAWKRIAYMYASMRVNI